MSLFVTLVFGLIAVVSCSGLSAIPLEKVDDNVDENKSTEVSEAVAAVQLWLCIICACQAPLSTF